MVETRWRKTEKGARYGVSLSLPLSAGTVAEGAPVIPISAQLKYNIEVVCEYVTKNIPIPLRDFTSEPRLIGEGRGGEGVREKKV